MTKLPYREGDLFALPLRDSGFGIGLVARSAPRGRILFGFVFRPRYAQIPTIAQVRRCSRRDAIISCRFGDLHLIDGTWHVLGAMPSWDRLEWTLPSFVRSEEPLAKRKWEVVYDDSDPSKLVQEGQLDDAATCEPANGPSGAGAVQTVLTKRLSQ